MKKQIYLPMLTIFTTSCFTIYSAAHEDKLREYTPYKTMPSAQTLPSLTAALTRAHTRDLLSKKENIPYFVSKEAFESIFNLPLLLDQETLPAIAREYELYRRKVQQKFPKVKKDLSLEELQQELALPFTNFEHKQYQLLGDGGSGIWKYSIITFPGWLEENHFSGLSIHDLIENELLNTNDMKDKAIDDLSGIQDLSAIERINLAENRIHCIPARIFTNFKALRMLILSYNPIENIDAEAFVGLDNLEYLDLSDTRYLSTFPIGTFTPLKKLRGLNLSRNAYISLAERIRIQEEIPQAEITYLE